MVISEVPVVYNLAPAHGEFFPYSPTARTGSVTVSLRNHSALSKASVHCAVKLGRCTDWQTTNKAVHSHELCMGRAGRWSSVVSSMSWWCSSTMDDDNNNNNNNNKNVILLRTLSYGCTNHLYVCLSVLYVVILNVTWPLSHLRACSIMQKILIEIVIDFSVLVLKNSDWNRQKINHKGNTAILFHCAENRQSSSWLFFWKWVELMNIYVAWPRLMNISFQARFSTQWNNVCRFQSRFQSQFSANWNIPFSSWW